MGVAGTPYDEQSGPVATTALEAEPLKALNAEDAGVAGDPRRALRSLR